MTHRSTLSAVMVGLALAVVVPLSAQEPQQLSAVVSSNFALHGFGSPWAVAPGSDAAVAFAFVLFKRTEGADLYSIRASYSLGDERRAELKLIESAVACPSYLNYTPAWPCAAVVVLARGADTLRLARLLSVEVSGLKTLSRAELKLEE